MFILGNIISLGKEMSIQQFWAQLYRDRKIRLYSRSEDWPNFRIVFRRECDTCAPGCTHITARYYAREGSRFKDIDISSIKDLDGLMPSPSNPDVEPYVAERFQMHMVQQLTAQIKDEAPLVYNRAKHCQKSITYLSMERPLRKGYCDVLTCFQVNPCAHHQRPQHNDFPEKDLDFYAATYDTLPTKDALPGMTALIDSGITNLDAGIYMLQQENSWVKINVPEPGDCFHILRGESAGKQHTIRKLEKYCNDVTCFAMDCLH